MFAESNVHCSDFLLTELLFMTTAKSPFPDSAKEIICAELGSCNSWSAPLLLGLITSIV